jgi:hypothetical protein
MGLIPEFTLIINYWVIKGEIKNWRRVPKIHYLYFSLILGSKTKSEQLKNKSPAIKIKPCRT